MFRNAIQNASVSSISDLSAAISNTTASPTNASTCAPDQGSTVTTIPLVTRTAKKGGKYVSTDLTDLKNGLYVNVQIAAVGSVADTGNDNFDAVATNTQVDTDHASRNASVHANVKAANSSTSTAGAMHAAQVDTGSWATVLPASWLEQQTGMTAEEISRYPSGSLTYTSSDNVESGNWVPVTLAFPDAKNPDGSMVTSTVTALIVDDSKAGSSTPFMIGSGMDAAFAIPTTGMHMSMDNVAFLNTKGMHDGTQAHSFAIDSKGIELGMAAADADAQGGWTTQHLDKSTIGTSPVWSIQDWKFPTTDVTVDGHSYKNVSTMIDTGIDSEYFEHAAKNGGDYKYTRKGKDFGVSMTGDGGSSTSWSYTLPGGQSPASGTNQDLAPSTYSEHPENDSNAWTVEALNNVNPSYMNTGTNPLRQFDYLFDADQGIFGLHDRKS